MKILPFELVGERSEPSFVQRPRVANRDRDVAGLIPPRQLSEPKPDQPENVQASDATDDEKWRHD